MYLEEQHKWHPLVIGFVGDLVLHRIEGANPGVGGLVPDLGVPMLGEGEGGQDIAVGIDNLPREVCNYAIITLNYTNYVLSNRPGVHGTLHDAADFVPIANPFQAGHEEGAAHEHDHGHAEVESVCNPLRARVLQLPADRYIVLKGGEYAQHLGGSDST